MTSDDSPKAENEALLKKIAAMEHEVVAIRSALSQGRVVRLLMFAVALALIVGAVWMFYNLALQMKSKENLDLLAAEVKELLNNNSGEYMRQVQILRENCVPVLTKAFTEQAKADVPKYTAAIRAETDILKENLEAKALERVTAKYQEAQAKYTELLQEEFPEIDDPEIFVRMNSNIDKVTAHLVEKYYSEHLHNELLGLYDSWDAFTVADAPGDGDTTVAKQLIGSLLQLVELKLAENPGEVEQLIEGL